MVKFLLFVVGEHPAAMQHGNTAVGMPTSGAYLLLVLILGQFR